MKRILPFIALGIMLVGICSSFNYSETPLAPSDSKKDSIRNVFESFLAKHQPSYENISVEDFLRKNLTDKDGLALQDEYRKVLPVHPDDLYCLLLTHFKPLPRLDTLSFDETMTIMSFQSSFENGISYWQREVESGAVYRIILPTSNDSLVRSFFVNYHTFADHHWENDSTYFPTNESAGCDITLYKQDKKIVLEMYCGC